VIELGTIEEPAPDDPQFMTIEPDWKAYFAEFERAHGGSPVLYAKTFLYRDGYRYSCTDYAGPEYRPPDNPVLVRKLCETYWRIRAKRVTAELNMTRSLLDNLREQQAQRSVPLQCKVIKLSDEGVKTSATTTVDWRLIELKIMALEGDLLQAQQGIAQHTENADG